MRIGELAHSADYARWDDCDHGDPWIIVDLREYHRLIEATYKEIASLIDGNFLNQKVRADELTRVEYQGFQDDTLQFLVPSSKFDDNHIKYTVQVKFSEWDQVGQDTTLNFAEKARLLLWAGNIKLFCSCPSYLYYGYQQIQTQLDAAIYPEDRFPEIRNPTQRGACCKHQNRMLRVLPFYSGRIAAALRDQFGAAAGSSEEDSIPASSPTGSDDETGSSSL